MVLLTISSDERRELGRAAEVTEPLPYSVIFADLP
jgi:hypothetical protein